MRAGMILSYSSMNPIPEDELRVRLGEALEKMGVRGERVLVIVPDDTRTVPMPALFETISSVLIHRGGACPAPTFLVALGTHPALTQDRLGHHLGPSLSQFPGVQVVQHQWDDPQALIRIGTISQEEMGEISRGLLYEEVPIEINRLVLEADLIFILGPVFPHEVAGFSGGHKYFFPGVSGPEMVHTSHWLGALITNPKVNGHKQTPVREMIERAAQFVPTPRFGISLVMHGHDLHGIFVGGVNEAWSEAVDLSAKRNIIWAKHPFHTVLSIAPPMYRDIWTAGKCMYKLEPVVGDGGTIIIYAPHIHEISPTHGEWLLQIGYHVRDYFLAQWEKFREITGAVLAHSTHVKGIGTYQGGVERSRIEVVLATGIPEEVCRRVNLGYRNPASIRTEKYMGQDEKGVLVVSNAGEMLWRLSDGTVPDIDQL